LRYERVQGKGEKVKNMRDFNYYAPTEVVFGEQSEEQVAALVKKYGGTKVLVHYGGKSAERSGLLDKICNLLSQGGIPYVKLGGVVLSSEIRASQGIFYLNSIFDILDMKQTIKLNTIYSADLYTRSRASELRACINDEANEVILDFEGIGFMSRSFADEVCNIVDDNKNIKFDFINRSADVEAMMNKVAEGRRQERKRGISNATIHKFEDMESLSEFLIAM